MFYNAVIGNGSCQQFKKVPAVPMSSSRFSSSNRLRKKFSEPLRHSPAATEGKISLRLNENEACSATACDVLSPPMYRTIGTSGTIETSGTILDPLLDFPDETKANGGASDSWVTPAAE